MIVGAAYALAALVLLYAIKRTGWFEDRGSGS